MSHSRMRIVSLFCLFLWLVVVLSRANASGVSDGRVSGTVSRIFGDHVVPVSGASLSFYKEGDAQEERKAITENNGRYSIDLPQGTYRILLHWFGNCAEIHRAPFTLDSKQHFQFDFLVASCGIADTERFEVPLQGDPTLSSETRSQINAPSRKEGVYQEQCFSRDSHGRPEILVSFGQSESRDEQVTYYPLQEQVVKNLSQKSPIVPKPLPVTITFDRYTIRALTVVLKKNSMEFEARGDVSVSDGVKTQVGKFASLSFAAGRPDIHIKH